MGDSMRDEQGGVDETTEDRDTSPTGDAGEQSAEFEDTPAEVEGKASAGIASTEENEALEHTEGGGTTRDGTDAGVPMMQGDASEPVGPEDAFGEGQKRGDYSQRVGGSHAESVPIKGGGEPVLDEDGNVVDISPRSKLVSQTERAGDQGEVPGEKGGVTTAV